MKTSTMVLFASILFLPSFSSLVAEEKKWSIEGHYKHFEYNYSPKDVFLHAQNATIWLSKRCEKGKSNCKEALKEFNLPKSIWNNLDARHPQLSVNDYEGGRAIAHPNPKLHKLLGILNLADKIKDHHGKYYAIEARDKLRKATRTPRVVWISTYSTWTRAVTGLKDPLYSLLVVLEVPGTTYQVQAGMPFRAVSTEELDQKIIEIEDNVVNWLSDEYKNLTR